MTKPLPRQVTAHKLEKLVCRCHDLVANPFEKPPAVPCEEETAKDLATPRIHYRCD